MSAKTLLMPEYVFAFALTAILGWGGFTWRKAENAVQIALKAENATDKLELKLAEKYLSKEEFEMQMDRLFKILTRLEEKLDYHAFNQAQDIGNLRRKLSIYEKED